MRRPAAPAVVSVDEKYDAADVVAGWATLSRAGLQAAEQVMIRRHSTPGGLVVDLGCGAGRAGLGLAPQGDRVVGIDRSAPMLAVAGSLHDEAGLPRLLARADFRDLPFRSGVASLALVLIAGLQHISTVEGRRRALSEAGRTLDDGGVLLIGIDNLAPALVCYGWWAGRAVPRLVLRSRPTNDEPGPGSDRVAGDEPPASIEATAADRALSAGRQGHSSVMWHTRGLLRTLRWRTIGAAVDAARWARVAAGDMGDTTITQVSPTATAGRVPYHRYAHDELVSDAAYAGLVLVEARCGSELADGRSVPDWVRQRDKQVLYAFARGDSNGSADHQPPV